LTVRPVLRAFIVKEKQADMPVLSEATRRLVELGLTVKTHARLAGKTGRRSRTAELQPNRLRR
jgi:hypothetical protein